MNRFVLEGIQAIDVTGRSLDTKELAEERVRQSVVLILESNVLGSIATVTPEGRPQINTAYFSYSDGLELYFLFGSGEARDTRDIGATLGLHNNILAST